MKRVILSFFGGVLLPPAVALSACGGSRLLSSGGTTTASSTTSSSLSTPPSSGGGSGGGAGGSTAVTVYPVVGSSTDDTAPPAGPGLVLMGGGTDVDAAFVWAHDTIAGSATATRGDLIVLRATGDNAYDAYIAGLAPWNSVRTILLPPPSSPSDLALAASYVEHAEGVFFAGGDQADYVAWKGTPLMAAVSAVYARGGVVGGTSAGCSIQGPYVYDSVADDAANADDVATADAVADPYESIISFTRGMLTWPTLGGVITDPHFVVRDRLGRLMAFVARQYADGAAPTTGILGVGIDEENALLVDKTGKATLVQQAGATGGTYLLAPSGPATQCVSGQPLRYSGVQVTRLGAGDTYDFAARCGSGTTYVVSVDGSQAQPYTPSDPYTAAGATSSCP